MVFIHHIASQERSFANFAFLQKLSQNQSWRLVYTSSWPCFFTSSKLIQNLYCFEYRDYRSLIHWLLEARHSRRPGAHITASVQAILVDVMNCKFTTAFSTKIKFDLWIFIPSQNRPYSDIQVTTCLLHVKV